MHGRIWTISTPIKLAWSNLLESIIKIYKSQLGNILYGQFQGPSIFDWRLLIASKSTISYMLISRG